MQENFDTPSPSFRLIAVVALCIGIGAGAWAFFALIIPSISDDGKTVYIQADKSPIKTTPDQPGGMDIPHQDKLVFNAVTPGSKPVSEHLAPPPEQPVYAGQPPVAPVPVTDPTVAPATPATSAAPTAPTPAATGTVQAGVTPVAPVVAGTQIGPTPGQTDAPGQGSGPQRKVTMPIALGRAIEPVPGAPVAPVKVAEPAASFDFKDGGAPPAPAIPKTLVADAIKGAPAAKPPEAQNLLDKNLDKNEVFLSQDPNAPRTTPDTGPSPASALTTADDKPILPSAQKVAVASMAPVADDSDGTDDTVDDTTASAEDASPPTAKKSKHDIAAAPKQQEEEPVAAKPVSGGSSRYQLASYTDKASAQRAIGSFGSKYSGMIAKSSLTVVSGQANGKQVYRVQGSASSKDEASSICSRVKAKGGSCVTIR